MTFEQYMRNALFERGMLEPWIDQVMERTKADPANEAMDRWTDQVEGYPDQFAAFIWYSTKRHALQWIDENLPRAWFRPMFE